MLHLAHLHVSLDQTNLFVFRTSSKKTNSSKKKTISFVDHVCSAIRLLANRQLSNALSPAQEKQCSKQNWALSNKQCCCRCNQKWTGLQTWTTSSVGGASTLCDTPTAHHNNGRCLISILHSCTAPILQASEIIFFDYRILHACRILIRTCFRNPLPKNSKFHIFGLTVFLRCPVGGKNGCLCNNHSSNAKTGPL